MSRTIAARNLLLPVSGPPIAVRRSRLRRVLVLAEMLVAADLALLVLDTDLRPPRLLLSLAIVGIAAAAAVGLLASDGPVRRGFGALVAGLVGVPAGIGFATHVVGGISIPAALGILATCGGALLLAAGTVTLVGAIPGWWRLMALSVAFVLLQFVLLPFTMAAFGTHPPRLPFTVPAPAGALRVTFPTRDGVTLAAWYTPSRNGAAVVVLHGAGGSKADTVTHADVLERHGYGVLAVDARGGGESGGQGMLWGWYGERDVAAAVDFLALQPDLDRARIGALGLSMGGEEAITAAAEDRRLAAVVAEGASVRVPADLAWLGDDVQGRIEAIYYPIMWGVAGFLTDEPAPVSLAEAVRHLGSRRLLLIESNDPNDAAAGPVIRDAAPSNVELWAMADTGHTQGLATHPGEWERRVIGFLDATLGPR